MPVAGALALPGKHSIGPLGDRAAFAVGIVAGSRGGWETIAVAILVEKGLRNAEYSKKTKSLLHLQEKLRNRVSSMYESQ